jgi:hypothetical protein
MDYIRVDCTHCGRHFKAPHKMAGRKVACPSCRHALEIPTEPIQDAAVPPTPEGAGIDKAMSLLCVSPRRDWSCRLPGSAWQAFPFLAAHDAGADLMVVNPDVGSVKFIHHVWFRRAQRLHDEAVAGLQVGILGFSLLQDSRQMVAGEPAVVLEYKGTPAGESDARHYLAFALVHDMRLFLAVGMSDVRRRSTLRLVMETAMASFTVDESEVAAQNDPGPPEMPEGTLTLTPALLKAGTPLARRGGIQHWSDEHGFSFGLADPDWTQTSEDEARQKDCLMQFSHDRLGMIRVTVGEGARNLAALQSKAQQMIAQMLTEWLLQASGETAVCGCNAVFLEGQGNIRGRRMWMHVVLFQQGPWAYQLLFACDLSVRQALREEAQCLLDSWRFQEPTTVPRGVDTPSGWTFYSDAHDYSITVPTAGWVRESPESEEKLEVDMQMQHPSLGIIRCLVSPCSNSFEEMFSVMETAYRSDCGETFILMEKGCATVAGEPAGYVVFQGSDAVTQELIFHVACVFVHDERLFQVIGMSPPAGGSRITQETRHAVESLRLNTRWIPDELVTLLQRADHDVSDVGTSQAIWTVAVIAGFFLLSWWTAGFCTSIGLTVVVGFVALAILGTIIGKRERHLVDTKYRQGILSQASAAGISADQIAGHIKRKYDHLKDPW